MLLLKNESLAECFNTGKERRNDEDGEVALHAGVQAGGGAAGAIGAKHGGGFTQPGAGEQTLFNWVKASREGWLNLAVAIAGCCGTTAAGCIQRCGYVSPMQYVQRWLAA